MAMVLWKCIFLDCAFPGSWGNIISKRMSCFFITWESSYLWLILPDRCQSLAQRPFFLLQDNHIASQICLWPPNQFIWANNPPIRVFHDWRAHGLMVLRGKHGNSSNFADPPHTNRLEDKSSELKHVCEPVVALFDTALFKKQAQISVQVDALEILWNTL